MDRATVPRQPRSILLVTLDTTRADHLSPYGAENVETPHLQALAGDGVLFRHAYSVAPITLVAHTSILTGLYPPEHGVRNNGTHYVPDELETLAEILAREDYRTAAFVSAAVLEKRYGLPQGFELYDDDLSSGRERHPRMVPDRPAEATVDSALAWLDGVGDDERFFAWVHFYDPHAAYSPPAPYRDRFRDRPYDGEIAYMDAQIGRLLEHPRLRRNQELVVSVIGDHGESFGEHGEQTHAVLAYDATLRVPWILRLSGGPKGLVYREPVSQVDVLPTLLDAVDLEPSPELPGISTLRRLDGSNKEPRGVMYSETYLPYYSYGWAKLKVLRRGFLKYIEAPTPELYDLRRDPNELSNRFQQQPGDAHDLSRDLAELMQQVGDPERETSLQLDAEAADKLRSLGYLAIGSVSNSERQRPDPKDVVHLHVGLEKARRFMQDRLYEQAAQQLRQVLQEDATNLAALNELSMVYEEQGKSEEGLEVVQRALALDPQNPGLTLRLASFEAQRQNLDKALELTQAVLEMDPNHLESRIQRALFLQRQRKFEAAEEELERALEREPQHPRLNALYSRMVEMRRGELEAAEQRLRRVLTTDPFLVLGYRLLGDVLARRGAVEEAVDVLRQGLERAPDDPQLHARLGLLLARNGLGGAETERHLSEAIRLSETFQGDLHAARGGLLAEQGRLAEALDEYERVLAVEPGNVAARNNRAIAWYQMGRQDEAVQELRQVIAEHPKHADSYNNLAAIAIHRRDWPEVERQSRAALAVDDGLVQAWNNLAVGLEEQDQTSAAEKAYRRALELEDGYWQARFNLGVLLRKAGRLDEAKQAFERVLVGVPGFPDVHLELGELLSQGSAVEVAQARDHWNAWLRLQPQHPRAEEIRQRIQGLAERPSSGN